MLNIDLKNHPYEVYYNGQVRWAKEHNVKRVIGNPPPKPIADHIVPKWNDEEQGYGMWNGRLKDWVKAEFEEIPHTFQSPELAKRWYRDLI